MKVLDPCCGTGNFLLQLPDVLPFDSIYGNDIDAASVKITRLNMALKYNVPVAAIYEHITGQDYLTDYAERIFSTLSVIRLGDTIFRRKNNHTLELYINPPQEKHRIV